MTDLEKMEMAIRRTLSTRNWSDELKSFMERLVIELTAFNIEALNKKIKEEKDQ